MTDFSLVFISATGMDIPCLSAAAETLGNGSLPVHLRVTARTSLDLFDEASIARTCAHIRAADAVVLFPHGGASSIPGFDDLLAAATGTFLHVQPTEGSDEDILLGNQHTSDVGSAACADRLLCLRHGGVANYGTFVLGVLASCGVEIGHVPAPEVVPFDGIYHPELDSLPEVEDYLSWARRRLAASADAPVVGFWFYQGYWVGRDLTAVDAIIAEIERQGGIPLPVFHRRFPDADLGNRGAPAVFERYFQSDGRILIDVLLSPLAFSLAIYGGENTTVYPRLGVPVLQMIATGSPRAVWEESLQGVPPVDVSISAAQPEFDGCLITTVTCTREIGGKDPATGAAVIRQMPVPDRIRRVVSLGLNWARLRRLPPAERRVAVLFHHYPPRNDSLGCACGLDSFESVKRLLDSLKAVGYTVDEDYPDGEALAHGMLARLTNDRRYLPPDRLAERAAARIEPERTAAWHEALPDGVRRQVCDEWGPPPGHAFVFGAQTLVGGIVNGNVFIGMQPPRGHLAKMEAASGPTETGAGFGQDGASLHDPDIPPTHHYLAYYRWIRHVFGAHAVIHVGKHGTLEWLPGKACGVSKTCWPDIVLEDLPNLYPYIINNPGEGTQAKRRSACCILDHLIPPQTSAGKSEDLRDVERLLEAVYQATHENPAKLPLLAEELWTAVEAANLQDDLGRSRQEALADLQAFARDLHGYLNRIGTISISDGLHILGQVPEGTRLNETLAQFTRLPVDPVGSLWDRVAAAMGFDGEDLRDNPGELLPALRRTKGQVLADVVVRVRSLFDAADEAGWETTALPRVVESVLGQSDTSVERVLRFVAETLRPNLLRTTEEIDNALAALSGRYVPAGGAGCPTRGMLDILPTGRNFYSVDPFKIPTPEAWKTGVKLGDALMAQYHEDTGAYPEQLAMVVWASPTMRTRGDDIAEIFYLMGLRPHWHHGNGRVLGLEVVPLEELAYPRVDITLRTSGLFRDAFPNLLDLLDEGVRMVAALQEPADRNILARNVAVRVRELELAGVTPEEARRRATFRVFSDRPGTYGAGVDILLESGTWKTPEELGDAYVRWGGYAYGDGAYGQTAPEELKQRLAAVDLTLKNEDSREEDILSSDDYNAYFGGLNAAVRYAGGRYARSYTGDTSDPRKPRHRATEAEGKFIFRARILNPKWIDGLKRHGYKGAGDLSRTVDICFQWDATSDILRDWQYKRLAETYAFDPDMQEFFRQHNPDALHNIAERLLEAIRRGMWEKPGDSEGRLEALYLETEGDIEDRLG